MLRLQSPPSSVSQKVPVKEPPSGSPMWAPMGRVPVSRAFFYVSLEFLIKVLLIKKIVHPYLEGPRKGASLHVPQNGAPMETDVYFKSLVKTMMNLWVV